MWYEDEWQKDVGRIHGAWCAARKAEAIALGTLALTISVATLLAAIW